MQIIDSAWTDDFPSSSKTSRRDYVATNSSRPSAAQQLLSFVFSHCSREFEHFRRSLRLDGADVDEPFQLTPPTTMITVSLITTPVPIHELNTRLIVLRYFFFCSKQNLNKKKTSEIMKQGHPYTHHASSDSPSITNQNTFLRFLME